MQLVRVYRRAVHNMPHYPQGKFLPRRPMFQYIHHNHFHHKHHRVHDVHSCRMNLDQLIQQVSLKGENAGSGVKIFTIAYGDDANVDALTKIANAAGGKEYKGTPQNIRSGYDQISQFF